jgi:hypothetical protein
MSIEYRGLTGFETNPGSNRSYLGCSQQASAKEVTIEELEFVGDDRPGPS